MGKKFLHTASTNENNASFYEKNEADLVSVDKG